MDSAIAPAADPSVHRSPDLMSALLEWLRAHERPMTQLLGRFVQTESSSLDKAAVDRFSRMMASEWRRRGARVNLLLQRKRGDHVRAEWAFEAASTGQILVLGHLDTVYDTGTIKRMPFRVGRGRAWGPGAFDMKGGLVIALFAVDALKALSTRAGKAPARFHPKKRIVFLWTTDEELGSGTSRAVIEREARRSDTVLVLEPAAGPSGMLKTGRKAVGEMEIVVTGRAAHAGLGPQHGINAIVEMAHQIARISRWSEPSRGITVSAGVIEGGTRSNVIPDRARVLIDLRATRATDMRKLEQRFRRLRPVLKGAKLQISGGFSRPPLERKMSGALFAKAQALAAEAGIMLGETFAGGGSDGNFTAALGVPTLDGLGAVGENPHSPDEYVLTRSLPERAALLAALLASL